MKKTIIIIVVFVIIIVPAGMVGIHFYQDYKKEQRLENEQQRKIEAENKIRKALINIEDTMHKDFKNCFPNRQFEEYEITPSGSGYILEVEDAIYGIFDGEYWHTYYMKIKYNGNGDFVKCLGYNKTK